MEYELKLESGRVVRWNGVDGVDGVDASHRYVDANPRETVVAWRDVPHGLFIGLKPIIEPGDAARKEVNLDPETE